MEPIETPTRNWMRWVPAVAVIGVVTGFASLAWYSYHAGSQSVKEDDLLVVEADKAPLKEKPLDPGGMKFPNQDKTIFETFSGKAKSADKVERVLPAPEEPMPKDSETQGFISDKANETASDGKPEQVIGKDNKIEEHPTPKLPPAESPKPEASRPEEKPVEVHEAKVADAAKPAAGHAESKPAAKPAAEKPSATGGAQAQLGAYRSEAEARDAWNKMKGKHAALLGSRSPSIVKADLGSKGVYYRLRLGSFNSATEAKAFCSKLSAQGQACILPVGK